jgi:hypothetical protein
MSDKVEAKVNPHRIKAARVNATRVGVLTLLESLHLQPDECAMALIQVMGAFIATQSKSYEEFQSQLTAYADLLRRYAEQNKEQLEKELREKGKA